MSIDVEKLAQRVEALERKTASEELIKPEDKGEGHKDASEKTTLAAEIEALERKLSAANGQDIPPEVTMADVHPRTAADEEDEKDDKKASLVDPSGIEEQITQKRFTEVEDLEHGKELATGESMLDVAPTEYVARLRNASSRLDAVADYLEKTGRTELALRIDRIADAIDARVAQMQKA